MPTAQEVVSILEEIFRNILIMSAAGGILTLILLAARPLTEKRFSSGWRYYIWLSVLLVMTVPVSFLSQTLITSMQNGQESGAASGSRTVQIQMPESLPTGLTFSTGLHASTDVDVAGNMAASGGIFPPCAVSADSGDERRRSAIYPGARADPLPAPGSSVQVVRHGGKEHSLVQSSHLCRIEADRYRM